MDKGGRYIDVSVTLSPIRDAFGTVIGVSKGARDITERKRAEEQVRRLNLALKARSDSSQALLHADDESAYCAKCAALSPRIAATR